MGLFKYWIIAALGFGLSFWIGKDKTKQSLSLAKGMMKNMLSDIVGILLIIGLLVTFIPFDVISERMAGGANQLFSIVFFAGLGSVTIIPAFVAFPLVGSFMDAGIDVMSSTAFLTTLTMVGFATLKLEVAEFGKKFAFMRNGLSFIFAIIIALTMGVIL